MATLHIEHLYSGGLITNYFCSARCKHCLYSSSPNWPKNYMTPRVGDYVLRRLKELGCDSVHIGGGEPLLDPDALLPILATASEVGVEVEYIETNSSWYQNHDHAKPILENLLAHGVSTLLLSVSPFHTEFVPFQKVAGLRESCARVGMGVFLWQERFWKELSSLDPTSTHSLEEMEERFGPNYRTHLPRRFGLTMRGRALMYYQKVIIPRPFEEWIEESTPCSELAATGHFHADLFGKYLPGGCSGLAIDLKDLGPPLNEGKYPLLTALYSEGPAGLYDIASDYGFQPAPSYASKCHVCTDIRRHLTASSTAHFPEIHPKPYYQQMLTDAL